MRIRNLLLALASAGLLSCDGGGGDALEGMAAASVSRGTFAVNVLARGELESLSASPIVVPPVPTGALTVKELVEEGSTVEEGDVVVVFDDSQLSTDLETHEASLYSALRRIDRTQIQSRIDGGGIEVMKGVASLEKNHADSFVVEDETIFSRLAILENSIRSREAGETITFADSSLTLRGEYHEIDEKILRVQEKEAKGKVERVQTSLGKLVLTAPLPGMIVYKKNWRGSTVSVGDSLWPGNVLMSVVDPTKTSMKAWVLEKDATGIEEGTKATVSIDAAPEREFHGKVLSVAKLSSPIERGSPVKYFEVKIEIEDGDPTLLKPGMKGEVRLTTAVMEEALVIPRSALHGEEGEFHVLVAGAGGSEARPVELGAGDHVRVSVLSGLDAGEKVLLGRQSATTSEQPSS